MICALWGLLASCAETVPIDGARCDAVHPCPGGYICAGASCRTLPRDPPRRCDGDSDCPIGVCLVEAGFCVQCLDNSDCVNGACLPDALQCGCREPGHCVTGRCSIATSTCLPCFDDAQCASRACDVTTGICSGGSHAP